LKLDFFLLPEGVDLLLGPLLLEILNVCSTKKRANKRQGLLILEGFMVSLTFPLIVRVQSIEAELVVYYSREIEDLFGLIVLRSQARIIVYKLACGPGPLEHLYADLWHGHCQWHPKSEALCFPSLCTQMLSMRNSGFDILMIFDFFLGILGESHGSIALARAPGQQRVVINDNRIILSACLASKGATEGF
jgi:hypothetical protein